MTWKKTAEAWRFAWADLVEEFRPRYVAEVHRLTAKLRPQFEAGRLRGIIEEHDDARDAAPLDRLEDLCARHFGIAEGREWDEWDHPKADRLTAQMILAVSPSAAMVWDRSMRGCTLPDLAAMAAARDVHAYAIARRWRVPDVERHESIPELDLITKWAQEEVRA